MRHNPKRFPKAWWARCFYLTWYMIDIPISWTLDGLLTYSMFNGKGWKKAIYHL